MDIKDLTEKIIKFRDMRDWKQFPCGEPLLGESNIEEIIMVEKSKIKPGAKYFIIQASGDSMNKAGINDKDFLLCR